MLTSTNNPAITAYRVYHLGQTKLDRECRRQTPDLHRIVAHASIVDSVRRWSRDIAEPSETVLVESSSDEEDSDPFEDCYEDSNEYPAQDGDVAIFDCDIEDEDAHIIDAATQQDLKHYGVNTHVVEKTSKSNAPASPNRRPPPPPSTKHNSRDHSWRQSRPIMIRETPVEVDEDEDD
ncbi:hypothetical protein PV08_01594 [Exophiala spinifera]|uniref:Uncharacterized protein n=1 Tax=Exophiala spinifera TaxID=91928 RepID=A0A0D2BRK9_9EURO|nr:uncharacterized protein PV08_01594 [Exophiala spinifera]KIW21015.1 hypothetical protein PV08_01594 [Exophiala spinifera]